MKIVCPHCTGHMEAGGEWANQHAKCPYCDLDFAVPPDNASSTGDQQLAHLTNYAPQDFLTPLSDRFLQRPALYGSVACVALMFLVGSLITVVTQSWQKTKSGSSADSKALRLLSELHSGMPVSVPVQQAHQDCLSCSGGWIGSSQCQWCNGRGTNTTPSGYTMACNECGGRGRIRPTRCHSCGGTGVR